MTIRLPDPALKIDFAASLAEIRRSLLQDALGDTMRSLEVPEIDRALAECAPADSLRALAGHGLRGEIMFPVPVVLAANPRLLGYYRLLYGYSQKEFYTSATGIGRFKSMEERGVLTTANAAKLLALCRALCRAGAVLLAGIGQGVSTALLDDLTLLTLGPQLRGGANVRKGAAGIRTVFIAILELVRTAATEVGTTRIQIRNAAGRTVLIEFSPDPDIIIREEMSPGNYRGVIAIEVKGGSDFSNIHNRIGEAEKSHQKAKAAGYVECWTVVNVDRIDVTMAQRESPSTNRFYRISDIVAGQGEGHTDFRQRVIALTGIRA